MWPPRGSGSSGRAGRAAPELQSRLGRGAGAPARATPPTRVPGRASGRSWLRSTPPGVPRGPLAAPGLPRSTRLPPHGVLASDELGPAAVAQITFVAHLPPALPAGGGATRGPRPPRRLTAFPGGLWVRDDRSPRGDRRPGSTASQDPSVARRRCASRARPAPAPRAEGPGDTQSRRGGLWLKTESFVS